MINKLTFHVVILQYLIFLFTILICIFVPWFAEELTILPGMSGAMVEANPIEECAVNFNKKQELNHEEKAFCCQNDVQSEDKARSKTDAGLPRYYPIFSIVTCENN